MVSPGISAMEPSELNELAVDRLVRGVDDAREYAESEALSAYIVISNEYVFC